jgi:fructose-specific component phosphotransferase system IIB-like protein
MSKQEIEDYSSYFIETKLVLFTLKCIINKTRMNKKCEIKNNKFVITYPQRTLQQSFGKNSQYVAHLP